MIKLSLYTRIALTMAFTALVMSLPASLFAMTTPAAGTFGYDIYDVIVNGISKGAPGFAVGVAGVATAGFFAWKQQFPAMLGTLAGTGALVKADSLVTTFGAMI